MKKYQLFTISPTSIAENVIRTMPDMLFATDTAGEIKLVNQAAAKALGKIETELLDTPLSKHAKHSDTGRRPGEDSRERFDLVTKDGKTISTIASVSDLKDKQKKAVGKVHIFHDISDIFQTRNALAEADRELKRKEAELLERSEVLERLTGMTVDREKVMIELKQENERLKAQLAENEK